MFWSGGSQKFPYSIVKYLVNVVTSGITDNGEDGHNPITLYLIVEKIVVIIRPCKTTFPLKIIEIC